MGRPLHLLTLWQDERICAGNYVLCFSILMYRKGAWNSLNTLRALHFTVLKRKSKKAVKPLDTWSHRSLKSGRAFWGKWSQYSHPGPSLFLKHLHLVSVRDRDCWATQMFALTGSIPSLWLSSSHRWCLAPYMHHEGGTKPNCSPISSLLSLRQGSCVLQSQAAQEGNDQQH